MDQHLLFLINHSWTTPWLDVVMASASSWDLWWPFALATGLGLALFGGFRGRAFLAVAGLAIGLTDGIIVDTLKGVVGRPRPHEAVVGVRTLDLEKATPRLIAVGKPLREEYSVYRLLPPEGNSFPSGHASNNFAIAAVACVFFRRWGWVLVLPAALVSYSRVYVGSHWPSDIVVSAFLGAGLGLLTCAVAETLWRKASPRWLPRLAAAHPGLFSS